MRSYISFLAKNWRKVTLLLLFAGVMVLSRVSGLTDYLSFDAVKEHRDVMKDFVNNNYVLSVISFIILFLSTALFLPGAVILMLLSGFLFGVGEGVVYVNVAATAGSVLAFLSSRYLIGSWVQEKFPLQLTRFNREIEVHGQNYLFFLRIVPLFPFFAVNYLSGITKISPGKFIWTTLLGLLPCSVLYAYVGQKLGDIERAQDLFSPEAVTAFSLLGLFAILPVIVRFLKRGKTPGTM